MSDNRLNITRKDLLSLLQSLVVIDYFLMTRIYKYYGEDEDLIAYPDEVLKNSIRTIEEVLGRDDDVDF